MNRAVVIRTTRGLAEQALSWAGAGDATIVVGFDARTDSRHFAADAVGVLVAAGITVRFFDEPVPTPLVGYVVKQLRATAGIVITASHNPAEYNGYKIYAPGGVQLVEPADREIAARIERVGPANQVPRTAIDLSAPPSGAERLDEDHFEAYVRELVQLRARAFQGDDLHIVYTPLHGVGWKFAVHALHDAGHTHVSVVPEQAEPDPDFPTVAFPNPEEPAALECAIELANSTGADLVLANDPDADRLAVAVPRADRTFRRLSGNQIGVLLADYLLARVPTEPTRLIVSTIVSSPMIDAVARHHHARLERTLTGFKWIWSAALEIERTGAARLVLGYEEALGFSALGLVRDKDGISAAVLFADMAADCVRNGVSVHERLMTLYRQYGLWVSVQQSVTRPGIQGSHEIAHAMNRLRTEQPRSIAARRIVRLTDFSRDAESRPRWLPNTNMVGLDLECGGRVLVRPSGTEPKLKIYVDLPGSLRNEEDVGRRESDVTVEATALACAVVEDLGLG
jgi:phosphomannomutase